MTRVLVFAACAALLGGCALEPSSSDRPLAAAPTETPMVEALPPSAPTPPAPPAAAPADPVIDAVVRALDDERRARAFYLAVIAKLGDVQPFTNIAAAEARHAGHLIAILEARGVPVPPDTHDPASFDVPDTRAACCEAAAQSERDNVAMYDELNAQAAGDAEVLDAFAMLRDRSLTRHLPAFERCAAGQGGGPGPGPGRGNGPGRGRGAT